MFEVSLIVAPIFILIAIGYVAGRSRWLGPATASGLADFTFKIAIPALLFRAMVKTTFPDDTFYEIWFVFFGSAFAVWLVAALATPILLRRPIADSAPIAMSCSFGNVVMLGIPLSVAAFGAQAISPGALIVSLHSPLLWIAATAHIALTNRDGATSVGEIVRRFLADLSRNIIIVAIIAGTAWRLSGLPLPVVADQVIDLAGRAGIPCALVALGLSLVDFRIKGQVPTLLMILLLKCAVMPLVAWYLATSVFDLGAVEAGVCIVFAAMPTGANAYLFAVHNGRATNSASGAVALGTALAALSAAVVVFLLKSGVGR